MKKLLLALIRFYQKRISPLKQPCCRFYPTCSSYAMDAVHRYGALRGSWLAFIRILRCTPLCKGGIDPVPAAFSFFHPVKGEYPKVNCARGHRARGQDREQEEIVSEALGQAEGGEPEGEDR